MGLAIFDLCDTLYAANTTVGFLKFVGDGGNRRVSRAVDRWTRRSHPSFWIGAIAYRFFKTDIARRELIRSLAGMSEPAIREAARRYANVLLTTSGNSPILNRLEEHRRQGDQIVIASNSLDPVVQAIAEGLNVSGTGSRLAYRDGIATGALSLDLTGAKSIVLAPLLGDGPPVIVYTDNRSDSDLIALADRAVIVMPRGRPARKWAGEEHEYVQL